MTQRNIHLDEREIKDLRQQFKAHIKQYGIIPYRGGKKAVISKMMAAMGYPPKSSKGNVLRDVLTEMGIDHYRFISKKRLEVSPWARAGIPLGPKALHLGWECMQNSAVYEIVCRPTGRRYIGSSTRPDLRSNTHLCNLKQYWKYSTSNIFFGNMSVKKDVERYGTDAFYVDIIESAPGASNAELLPLERQAIANTPKRKLYNLGAANGYNEWYSMFAFDKRMSRLKKQISAYEKKVALLQDTVRSMRDEKNAKLRGLKGIEHKVTNEVLMHYLRMQIKKRDKNERALAALKQRAHDLNEQLKVEYAQHKTCLY